jgi:hypothetical protein
MLHTWPPAHPPAPTHATDAPGTHVVWAPPSPSDVELDPEHAATAAAKATTRTTSTK